jgi:hypothetical protein
MAGRAVKKAVNEDFITYEVVKPHDGLEKGELIRRKAGHPGAEYCVSLGLWKVRKSK